MLVTIKKSIMTAVLMMVLLVLSTLILTAMRIDRKVIIPGAFTYRRISPVVAEESGFVDRIIRHENSFVSQNDTILTLRNADIVRDIENAQSRIMIYRIELEEILQLKELDVSLSSYNTTKLNEELKVKKAEEKYLAGVAEDKRDLYEKKIISKDEYESSNIALRQKQLEIRSAEIQLNELRKRLQKLDASTYLRYQLKEKELAIEEDRLEYLNRRKDLLSLTSRMEGRLVADKLENLLNSYIPAGTHIGDIVSYEKINFSGYASGNDIIRIKEGQKAFFIVDTFRGRDFIRGTVKRIGLKPDNVNGTILFPIELEVDDPKFFDRGKERYLHAGVVGEAVIITEEDIPIFRLLWERVVKYADFN